MISKNRRLAVIMELVNKYSPSNQSKLLRLLHERGFPITLTTLSRDIKELKVIKTLDERGYYSYTVPDQETVAVSPKTPKQDKITPHQNRGFVSLDFSHNIGIIKTRQGYSNGIVSKINYQATTHILGAIGNEKTVIFVIREGSTRKDVVNSLAAIIPGIENEK